MTSVVKLHAISGAMGESPPCYELKIDDFRILLDCGWDEHFGMEAISELKKNLHKIDCVLLSHSDTYHLGALPYLVGKCGLSCPIYATVPVFKMGQMFMYDTYLNRHNSEDFNLFNLDDIDAAFDQVLQLQYNQPVSLKGRGLGISITALPAGHSLGGTVWKISKTGEQDIFYAIDHNNKKERHLNGFEFETIQRPGIFITNALNALYVQEKRRKRDEMLLGVMQQTLRTGGNVLVATDSAGRALELVLMIDQMWRMKDSGLSSYALVFLNNVAFNVIDYSKSQVEWMSEKLIKAFENQKINPFQLKNVVVCHTLLELGQIGLPKVVITSSADLECGFARDLFLQWCQDPLSSVVITSRTSPGTLGRTLVDGVPKGKRMDLETRQRVKLEGKELEEFNQRKLNEKNRKSNVIDIEDSDDEPEILFNNHKRNYNMSRSSQSEDDCLIIDESPSSPSSTVFKMNNNNHTTTTFPDESQSQSQRKRRRFSDYGEPVRREDFKENEKRKNGNKEKLSRKSTSDGSDSEPPTKTVAFTNTFSINCKVLFIDFEGRSDVEAVLKMFQEIQPQQLVLVRGTPQATLALDALTQKLLPNTKIFKPSLQRVVNLTNKSVELLQVKLTDGLASSLDFSKVRDYEVSWVDGQLCENASNNEDVLQSGHILDLLEKDETPSHSPIVISRLRLPELRQTLEKNGIQCELKNKTIYCTCTNGMVYVQKDPSTHSIHIECDGLPEEYYKIRSMVYDLLAML